MKDMYEQGIQAIDQINAIMANITPKMNGYQQICRRYKRLSNEVKDCSKLVKRMHKAGVLTDEVEAGIFSYMTELKTQYEFQKKTLEMIPRLHSPYTKEVNALMKKVNEHVKNVDKLLLTEEEKGEWDIEKVESYVNALLKECRRKVESETPVKEKEHSGVIKIYRGGNRFDRTLPAETQRRAGPSGSLRILDGGTKIPGQEGERGEGKSRAETSEGPEKRSTRKRGGPNRGGRRKKRKRRQGNKWSTVDMVFCL